ncbi:preprotein translocase subunit SecE [Mycoplasmopsis felis]|uniref:Protein translocase subunit SecE n=1 Tax=Mycoplasmopsis felis TaxID=33923 RepID=A0A809SEX0_9BACT|nr:preprotein translocase subunit SecE [Mycoplasmopsis felis]MCU9939375.1 preprotein translocase subunit SecE [Mycoplasmopsis felis]UWV78365.1 preprotein translocase subunit SecE [Mycoplasmopsis felis]UWV83897.1 preprotein translocase subunit SecE [Mycoplasmopsis felis]UWV85287.1 preprotein translocase subunit SecE [Mycoplasmopsis felis]UWW00508.1 preprotein translocase subunit SecE [Mycoplasmopsis felis]
MSNKELINKTKEPRKKRYWFRKFIKEMKRVRWPDTQTNLNNLIKIIIFTIIFTIFVSLLTFGFTKLWEFINI